MLWVAIRRAPNSLSPEERLETLQRFDASPGQWMRKLHLIHLEDAGPWCTTEPFADILKTLTADYALAAKKDVNAVKRWSTHDGIKVVLKERLMDAKWPKGGDHSVENTVAEAPEDQPLIKKRTSELISDAQQRAKRRKYDEEYERDDDEEAEEDLEGEDDLEG